MPDQYGGAYRDAHVLVTGGAGFIGSHLVRRLRRLAARPRVIDDLSTGRSENLGDVGADLRVASILDDAALASAMEGCSHVFHLAAMVSVPLSVEQPLRCARINIEGTGRVLDAARASGCGRLVFVSSAAVYGDPVRLPSREDDAVDCRSPYAASKAAGEALVAAYGRCYDEVSTVSLRFFNVFGPRQDPHSAYAAAIVAFEAALAAGVRPTVYGDGHQSRDFVHVDNIVHAMLLAGAHEPPLRGEVYNIGTGKATSLREALAVMNRVRGTSLEPVEAAARAGDVRHSAADIARAREELGYDVRVGFEEGIRGLMGV